MRTTQNTVQRAAIYARVSTNDQDPEAQLQDLRRYADRRGWTVVDEYVDQGISGTKEKRQALDRLMADARRKHFDIVVVWRFDRFARSTKHLVTALEEFRYLGITFVSHQENLDLGSPMGEAMFTIIAAIAKLERDIIAERVRSGLRRARSKGTRLGRPRVAVNVGKVARLRLQGMSVREIAADLGVTRYAVHQCLKNLDAAA